MQPINLNFIPHVANQETCREEALTALPNLSDPLGDDGPLHADGQLPSSYSVNLFVVVLVVFRFDLGTNLDAFNYQKTDFHSKGTI